MSAVMFIGAVGRSGTTLLERTLATSPNVIALGEMVHLWERGVRDDEPCGCGAPFSECQFWQDVGQEAFGGWDRVDLGQLTRDRRAVERNRFIPFLLAPNVAPASFRSSHARLVTAMTALYFGIQTVAATPGNDVVLIDSSKHPSYLFLLRTLRLEWLGLLHVVRDPRGVAYSWSKRVVRPESGDAMEQLGTLKACARWTSHNLCFQLAGRIGVPPQILSYESFTSDPEEVERRVDALLQGSGISIGPLAIDGAVVSLGSDHTVSGNPMRFRAGRVAVRSDDAWRDAMPRRLRLIVGALTTPLRQMYAR